MIGESSGLPAKQLIVRCPLLNAQLLQVMATRVSGLQQLAIQAPVATVTIIGHRFDLACHALRDFLTRNHVAFRWHDPRDPEARVGLSPTPQPDETFPVVRFADGTKLTTPTRSFRWRYRCASEAAARTVRSSVP